MDNILDIIIQSIKNIKLYKLRSFLTMLGIIIGVFSIVSIITISDIAKNTIKGQFDQLGANILEVMASDSSNTAFHLNYKDIDTIYNLSKSIKHVDTSMQDLGYVDFDGYKNDSILYGVTDKFKYFSPYKVTNGRFINDKDVLEKRNVAVVDEYYVKKYQKNQDPIGKVLNLENQKHKKMSVLIIGVIKQDEGLSTIEQMPINVYMPLSLFQDFFEKQYLDSIKISINENEDIVDMGNRVKKGLEFKYDNQVKFMVSNHADIQNAASSMINIISILLVAIASISLLVGGVGIINILLVSVNERIREIGIRKAVGAKKKDIIMLFMAESVIITLASGVIGVVASYLVSFVIISLLNIDFQINIIVIIGAILGSIALGLIFGVYPAKKASELQPVDALRYE